MARTDTHAPTSFDPDAYAFAGVIDLCPDAGDLGAVQLTRQAYDLRRTNPFKGNFHAKATCDHCGSAFRYGILFQHVPTSEFVVFGHQCAEGRVGSMAQADFQLRRMQKAAKAARKAEKTRKAKAAWLAENGDVKAYMDEKAHLGFIDSLLGYLDRKGHLTEGQLAAVKRMMAEDAEKAAEVAEEVAKPASESAFYGRVGERIEHVATVEFTKVCESFYGSSLLVVLVDSEMRRFKTFSTAEKVWDLKPGYKIAFRATVKAHEVYRDEKETQLTRVFVTEVLEVPQEVEG